jgi:hypothetical protein
MSKTFPMDPMAMWREIVSQWEKQANEMGNKTMGSEEFTRAMNKMGSVTFDVQQRMNDAIGRTLGAMNLPSRADITALGERLQAMERTLNNMAAIVERQAGANAVPAHTAMPPRTKRPAALAAGSRPAEAVREPTAATARAKKPPQRTRSRS